MHPLANTLPEGIICHGWAHAYYFKKHSVVVESYQEESLCFSVFYSTELCLGQRQVFYIKQHGETAALWLDISEREMQQSVNKLGYNATLPIPHVATQMYHLKTLRSYIQL